jgi:hypothetical protein
MGPFWFLCVAENNSVQAAGLADGDASATLVPLSSDTGIQHGGRFTFAQGGP